VHTDANAANNTHAYCYGHSDGYSDSVPYANCDSYGYTHSHRYANGDGHSHSQPNGNGYCDCDIYP
jgi:hypothetical protein